MRLTHRTPHWGASPGRCQRTADPRHRPEPAERGRGLGAALYERFFAYSAAHGRTVVRAITSPENKGSHAFHTRMGFVTEPGPKEFEGVPVQPDHNGPGLDRLSFRKDLGAPA